MALRTGFSWVSFCSLALGLSGLLVSAPAFSASTGGAPSSFSEQVKSGPSRAGYQVRFDGISLLSRSCEATCDAVEVPLDVPEAVRALPSRRTEVTLPGGERALLVRFGDDAGYAFVFLGAASPSEPPVLVLRGHVGGQELPRSSVVVDRSGAEPQLLTQRFGLESNLCGRSVPAAVHRLDGTSGRLMRVLSPLLSESERKAAQKLPVAKEHPPGDLLVAPAALLKASERDRALADGDRTTSAGPYGKLLLSEAGGPPVTGIWVTRAASAEGDAESEAAPAQIFLQVGSQLQSVALESGEGSWVAFPAPTSECVALLATDQDLVAEVAVGLEGSPLAQKSSAELAQALDSGDHELAARALIARGKPGIVALIDAVPRLGKAGRARVFALTERVSADARGRLLVSLLVAGDDREVNRAEEQLVALGPIGTSSVRAALSGSTPKAEKVLLTALAQLDPAEGASALAERLVQKSPARRLEIRKQLAKLADTDAGFSAISQLMDPDALAEGQAKLASRSVQTELVRALAPRLPSLSAPQKEAARKLMASARFGEAYRMTPGVISLGEGSPEIQKLVNSWLTEDAPKASSRERAALRVHLMNEAGTQGSRAYGASAGRLLEDPQMRVRLSAASYLSFDWAQLPLHEARLEDDEWPEVRASSMRSLGKLLSLPGAPRDIQPLIVDVLDDDDAPEVRGEAARVLSTGASVDSRKALRRALGRDDFYSVRAEAARSLGLLCDADSLDDLTDAALALTTAPTDPGVVDLGLAAATAVARIAPKDVDERLAPLFSDQVAGPIRARLRAQTERVGGMCQPDAKK